LYSPSSPARRRLQIPQVAASDEETNAADVFDVESPNPNLNFLIGLREIVVKDLLVDIEAAGGLFSPTFKLKHICNCKPDIYGKPASELRRQVQNKVHKLRQLNQFQYLSVLNYYGVASGALTRSFRPLDSAASASAESPSESSTPVRLQRSAIANVATSDARQSIVPFETPPRQQRSPHRLLNSAARRLAMNTQHMFDDFDMAGEANAEVWTNLANAFALQATDRAAASAPATKKGFEAFPVTTQQMILFASERTAEGLVRDAPVDTYTEVLGLLNAAYVAPHLHHHLKTRLGLDVLLPSGFCSAIRMASFANSLSDRPEAFSLFACGPQPLANRAGATTDDDTADKLMRMQLKVADSTTRLSDKDVKRLTLVKHTVPRDFRELAGLLENFAGVTELVFGQLSPLTTKPCKSLSRNYTNRMN
jgi:hypothetical protein